ncbi:hypothetical protein Mspyr1_05060 [Mycolicibacterium gilvum Spyr1]|uniref:Transmembrane protein n=1 Tax=Mycolicibacterium gilvum (strain DSM 45189 / LMG 24558 / Spyr1) TaxID=278137 RepID=E6TNP8_MYCSR|nr:hypothetical protein Mspyr1_05060 [Mycolicibacterium gilvum Spyr1]
MVRVVVRSSFSSDSRVRGGRVLRVVVDSDGVVDVLVSLMSLVIGGLVLVMVPDVVDVVEPVTVADEDDGGM